MKRLQYQINHKTKEFLVHSINYNLVDLKNAMDKEGVSDYSVVHVLEPLHRNARSNNITYVPNGLVQD